MKQSLSKKLPLIALFSLFFVGITIAQNKTLSDVLSINLRSLGPILENNAVKGYYMFYKVDKKDRKTNNYLLKILDQDLNEVSSKRISGSRYLNLIGGMYNGENVLLKFSDPKEKKLTFRQYNKQAELISKKTTDYDPKLNPGYNDQETMSPSGVYPVKGKGFVNFELVKNKKWGYEIKFFPTDENVKEWVYRSNKSAKEYLGATFLAANEKVILTAIASKPNIISKKVSFNLLGIDVQTGEKLFYKPMSDGKYNLFFVNSYKEINEDKLTLFGYYYDKGENVMGARSKGLCAFSVGLDGEFIDKKYLSWKNDISKKLPTNAIGKIKDIGFLYFHDIFKTSDGKIHVVAEQYKKGVDGVGIAFSALGGRGAVFKFKVEDMMTLEFSPDFELEKFSFFDKAKSTFSYPGLGAVSPQLAGMFINTFGGFDYIATQQHRDSDAFSFIYNDYERKGKKWAVHAITYSDGAYANDKIPLSSKRSENFQVFQGKKGHIMIAEYDKKKKNLDMRLEKINF